MSTYRISIIVVSVTHKKRWCGDTVRGARTLFFGSHKSKRRQVDGGTHGSRIARSPKTTCGVLHLSMAQRQRASTYLFLVQAAYTGTTKLGSAALFAAVNNPAASCEALRSKALKIQSELICMLKLDVPPNYSRRHLITNRAHKVTVASLQFLPQPWIAMKHLPRRYTLHYLYNLTRTVLRWCQQEQVHMIRHHLKHINLQFITLGNTLEKLLQSFSYTTLQDQLAVLRNPNKVILEVVYCVPSSPNRTQLVHTSSLIRLWRISAFLSPACWGVSTGALL